MGPGEGGGAGGASALPAGLWRFRGQTPQGTLCVARTLKACYSLKTPAWGKRCTISGLCFVLFCFFNQSESKSLEMARCLHSLQNNRAVV